MLRPEAVMVSLLLLLLLWAGPGPCEVERKEPPPCKEGRECLPYTVLCHGDGYQARRYPASSWVGTRFNSSDYTPALFRGFWRLFRYIQGANERQVKIPMTAPVLARVEDGQEGQGINVYFMLPEAFQEDPPTPTDQTVYLERFPPQEVYVRFFGGWMTDWTLQVQLRSLDAKLQEAGRATQAGLYYTAGFNSPWEVVGRRNEVWRIAQGELGCGSTLEE
uniref:Heme-binding protein 2-like n=1 Tax=Pogona vitticeps TaxID=103695 RepID=A0ABM5FF93_9SAUR